MKPINIAKCLIVDDDPLASKFLETHLKKFETIKIDKICNNPICAFEYLNKKQIDILFLDIHMPEINGLELLKLVKNKPYVIIVSASRDFAVESYELEVNDYIVKPVTLQRLLKAIQRFSENYALQNKNNENQNIHETYIHVKENYKTIKIAIDTILYIESFREYSHIHTEKRTIITKQNLITLENQLDKSIFIRIHKSYIVNLNKLSSYSSNEIQINKKSIPIGRTFKQKVLSNLKRI